MHGGPVGLCGDNTLRLVPLQLSEGLWGGVNGRGSWERCWGRGKWTLSGLEYGGSGGDATWTDIVSCVLIASLTLSDTKNGGVLGSEGSGN
ncbi:hypothetical protein SLA2020_441480 [Shorea laevis]